MAATIYLFDDFRRIFCRGLKEYKDYLLLRHEFLLDFLGGEPVRVVSVPFDAEEFSAWREENSHWRDDPEGHSAWALCAAKDRDALSRLRKRYPLLPGAPVDERFTVELFYAAVLVMVKNTDDILALGSRIPEDNAIIVAEEVRSLFEDIPAFEALSSIRCRGLCAAVGNRLVLPGKVEDVSDYLMFPGNLGDPEKGVVEIPRRYKISCSDVELGGGSEVFLPVFMPVLLVGSQSDARYAAEVLIEKKSPGEEVTGAVAEAVDVLAPGLRIRDMDILLIPSYKIMDFLEDLADSLLMKSGPQGLNGNKKKSSNLKRVK